MTATPEPANPVHMVSGAHTHWTTVNFAEAIQGVQLPLSWAMWSLSIETAIRIGFGALGVLARSEVPVPDSPDDRVSAIFYGRAAGNVAMFRLLGDRMPGSSGDVIEEKLFGKEPPAVPAKRPRSALRRYPIVAVSMPRAMRAAAKEIPPLRRAYRKWWQHAVLDAPPADLPAAQALYREAARRFIAVGGHHTVVTMLSSAFHEQLADLAEGASGDRSLANDLATGYGAMEETELIEDLWSAAKGMLSLDEVIRRHGYHGPDEGDLSNRTWREDRAPLEAMVDGYRRSALANPREREHKQLERRRQAEQRVLDGLPAAKRPAAKLTMKLASVYIPRRELGKAAFLHALDAARCAARVGGEELARAGALAEPDDVFFLTDEEFLAAPAKSMREVVAERKQHHERYRRLALPPEWIGDPTPVPLPIGEDSDDEPQQGVTELQGIGVVGDSVTGRARVLKDPHGADLEPGDILVCVTTDPSWTPLFMLAEGLVIDTGGQMSHGAIVARELGVTCVINTVTGTRDIPDGSTITVDGATGKVAIQA